ncbi:MAG: hypothetical protein ACK4XK_12075 [Casimicrobiaceae bacterium]
MNLWVDGPTSTCQMINDRIFFSSEVFKYYPDQVIPASTHMRNKQWLAALHAVLYMHHWAKVFYDRSLDAYPFEEGRLLHALVHLAEGIAAGVSQKALLKLCVEAEKSLPGFTKRNPLQLVY